jgi:predicted dithiol-disulfide oxidoreductase (DUF899 family)
MQFHEKRFPNESNEYREARNKLLDFEIQLREQVEKLGQMRQALPRGGLLKEDYGFSELTNSHVTTTKLSQLFMPQKNSLVIYSFMYGPQMKNPCPSCTSIIDSLNANAVHVNQHANLVVIAKSPIERITEFAKDRGWHSIRILSSANTSYNYDYFAETEEGDQMPALNVFTKTPDGIFHFYNTELLYCDLDGDPRHVDAIWPLWNLYDMLPEGRQDWYPKLLYPKLLDPKMG